MDELRFMPHAVKQMRLRGVTGADVANALANHHDEYLGTRECDATVVFVGLSLSGRSLAVVVDELDRGRIVTVFWKAAR